MSEVIKIQALNDETGERYDIEITGDVVQEYEISGEDDCLEFNAQGNTHILIVGREECDAEITVCELVDTFIDESCDTLLANSLPVGLVFPYILVSAAGREAFFALTDYPLIYSMIQGYALAKAGGTYQTIEYIGIP